MKITINFIFSKSSLCEITYRVKLILAEHMAIIQKILVCLKYSLRQTSLKI